MNDLERIELAARRTANRYGAAGTQIGDFISSVFEGFADDIAEFVKSKRKAEEAMDDVIDDLEAGILDSQDKTSGQ